MRNRTIKDAAREVVMMSVDDVKPYENNPRINDGAVDYVKESIRAFGFKIPIVVDEDNIILAGHTRLMAACELKMSHIPVIVAKGLTDEQKTAYRIADNRSSEFTAFDFEKVYSELERLKIEAPNLDMEVFGFEPLNVDIEPPQETESNDDESGGEKEKKVVVCPRCGKVVE